MRPAAATRPDQPLRQGAAGRVAAAGLMNIVGDALNAGPGKGDGRDREGVLRDGIADYLAGGGRRDDMGLGKGLADVVDETRVLKKLTSAEKKNQLDGGGIDGLRQRLPAAGLTVGSLFDPHEG
jgi:hypothetical protein